MKTSFIKELTKEAEVVDMKPSQIIKLAGFSSANWHNWNHNVNKPSETMQEKIRETVAKLKNKAPAQDSATVPSARAGEKTLSQLLEEKKAEAYKIANEISAIESLME